jgi:hypothetical protein
MPLGFFPPIGMEERAGYPIGARLKLLQFHLAFGL